MFFTTTIIDLIVDQTNLYASQVMDAVQYDKWTKVTSDEILAYFGFMILMGINQLPALVDYWKLDPTYRYRPIADKITRDRFLEISRYQHFVDNSNPPSRRDPDYDKFGKIRPVIDHISQNLLTVYNPHCEVSIDEAMTAFKGRSSMKQYLPKKPVKRGFKVWVRADAMMCDVCQQSQKSPPIISLHPNLYLLPATTHSYSQTLYPRYAWVGLVKHAKHCYPGKWKRRKWKRETETEIASGNGNRKCSRLIAVLFI